MKNLLHYITRFRLRASLTLHVAEAIRRAVVYRLKQVPVLGFVLRYWMLITFSGAAVSGILSESVFQQYGMLIYQVGEALGLFTLGLFIRHLFFRGTADAYVSEGWFEYEFWSLSPMKRQLLSLGYFAVIMLGVAYVVAGLAK